MASSWFYMYLRIFFFTTAMQLSLVKTSPPITKHEQSRSLCLVTLADTYLCFENCSMVYEIHLKTAGYVLHNAFIFNCHREQTPCCRNVLSPKQPQSTVTPGRDEVSRWQHFQGRLQQQRTILQSDNDQIPLILQNWLSRGWEWSDPQCNWDTERPEAFGT